MCGTRDAQWQPLTTDYVGSGNGPASGHYYLAESMEENTTYIPITSVTVRLHLNGKNITSTERALHVGSNAVLNIMGTGDTAAAQAQTDYMMITEADGTSFHRLNLDTVGVSIRAADTGMYYTGQFGGDEVIKRNIVAYGSALGAGKAPGFADKTYTRFEADTWKTGCDADGNSNNLSNGTLLQGILQMYTAYENIMSAWDLPNIKAAQ